ncbi:MAG: type II toxin-antitoxin system RelE/ParE family toxin [Amaricoccus sp.]
MKGKLARDAVEGRFGKRFPGDLVKRARLLLSVLRAATSLQDLRSPPGNRLEALTGDRAGQHSVRINDQWRVCFVWSDSGPENVEIVDYHG